MPDPNPTSATSSKPKKPRVTRTIEERAVANILSMGFAQLGVFTDLLLDKSIDTAKYISDRIVESVEEVDSK